MVVGLVTRTLLIVTCTMIPGSFPVTTSFPSSSSPSFYNRSSWWSHRRATKHCNCNNSSQNRQAHRLKTRLSKKTRIEPTCTINLPNQERDQRVQVRDQIRAVAEAAAAQAVLPPGVLIRKVPPTPFNLAAARCRYMSVFR